MAASGRRVATAVVVLAAAAALTAAQGGWGRSLLQSAGLVAPAPAFVELYFVGPSPAPAAVPAPGATFRVTFGLTRHGVGTDDVRWRLDTRTGDRTAPVSSGSARLADGDSDTVTRPVTVRCPARSAQATRTAIVVTLVGTEQQIVQWVSCGGTP